MERERAASLLLLATGKHRFVPPSHLLLFTDVLQEKCLSCTEGKIYTGCNLNLVILDAALFTIPIF